MARKLCTRAAALVALNYNPATGSLTWTGLQRGTVCGEVPGWLDKDEYRRFGFMGRIYFAHIMIWFMQTGDWPPETVDHKNRDKADLRWVNLRLANYSENQWNRTKGALNKSGFKGVCFERQTKKWKASFAVRRRCVTVGRFETAELANAAVIAARAEAHGKFARAA